MHEKQGVTRSGERLKGVKHKECQKHNLKGICTESIKAIKIFIFDRFTALLHELQPFFLLDSSKSQGNFKFMT